jgi:hypothetical protein
LKALLTIKHKALSLVIFGDVEVGQVVAVLRAKIFNELPAANIAFRPPDQKRADRVFPQYRVEQAAGAIGLVLSL